MQPEALPREYVGVELLPVQVEWNCRCSGWRESSSVHVAGQPFLDHTIRFVKAHANPLPQRGVIQWHQLAHRCLHRSIGDELCARHIQPRDTHSQRARQV